ncbi:hypothetical protein TrVE_jg12759 [Triparma verrucosa]|uniref:Protein phosphatase n=1 Tax=Triparma verrucosa TaxID=1606542 RepID=A0A9W7BST0_9STRA|nr:hypothetical protein TrVE_jg12759 [Triparma verrucosa]
MKTGESMWTPPPGTNFDSKQQAAKADSPSFALPNLFSNDAKKQATTATAASTTVTKQQATAATVDTVVEKPVYTDGASNIMSSLLGPPSSKIVPSPSPLSLEAGSVVLPHPEKLSWGGEDALYLPSTSSPCLTFGVFDGVSGAEKDASMVLYSRMLSTEFAKNVVNDVKTSDYDLKRLSDLLTEAAEVADAKATGATTALVGSISSDNRLRVLSLGDCSCLIIRDDKKYAQTRDISHFFDCPFQLGDISPDRPKDGTTLTVKLVPGDVIVSGSDGVFDNLSVQSICEIIKKGGTANGQAKEIADEARKVSLIETAETPYAVEAGKNKVEGYEDGLGGKIDDICCIVVKV